MTDGKFENCQPKDSGKFEKSQPKPVCCGCGGEAILKHYCYSYSDDDQYYFVWCERCDIQTKTYPTEAEAVEAWNRAMGSNVKDCAKNARFSDPDDLISRRDAVNAMMLLKQEDDDEYGCEIPECFDGKRAVEALEKLPSAEPERKFISFEVALPNDSQKVLCVNKQGEMMVGGYLTDYGMTFPCYFGKPVAWMPLPEPWRGDR